MRISASATVAIPFSVRWWPHGRVSSPQVARHSDADDARKAATVYQSIADQLRPPGWDFAPPIITTTPRPGDLWTPPSDRKMS